MPPYPGEERLLTLYADIHYYFAKPTARPLRHRFDKSSYFYIYYNSTRQSSRIEIANHPGTPDQDAVEGYLDKCRVVNAARFPTLVTLTVDAEEINASPTSPVTRDPDEWRLQSGDLRDTSHEKHKVHTLDIYFWSQDDAKLAVDFFKKLLTPAQLDVGEVPQTRTAPKSNDVTSPVVKNLENVAISDPAFQNGQTRDSQNQPQAIPVKLPPPPPLQGGSRHASPATESQGGRATSRNTARQSPQVDQNTTNFTPMAYNPAAPPAPEPISHREKTPPPEDGEGTGLSQAAQSDHGYRPAPPPSQQYTGRPDSHISQGHWGSPPPPTASGYGSPPPMGSAAGYGSPPPPSVTPGYSQASSVGYGSPPPQQQQRQSQQSYGSVTSTAVQSFAPPPSTVPSSQDPHRHSLAAETYTPDTSQYQHQPVETPGAQFYSTLPQERKPLQHVQPRYQTEYFSPTGSAAYPVQSQQSQHGGAPEYNVHQQAYVPDAAEQRHHKPPKKEKKPASSKEEAGSSLFKGLSKKVNKSANDMIKKIENSRMG